MKTKMSVRIVGVVAITLLALSLNSAVAQTKEDLIHPPPGEWPTYSRTLDGIRFSPLEQINRDNISDLRLAWSLTLGIEGNVQSTPVIWKGTMFINGVGAVLALDATTGDLIWEYRPRLPKGLHRVIGGRMRGGVIVYEGKVYYARNDAVVVALDAQTGEEIWSTTVGDVEIAEGFTSGPLFADGKIIVGPTGGDFGGNPGRILALDSQNGELLWTFHVVPREGEPGRETWDPPEAAERGGGSAWTPGVYDPVTRTIIYSTGNPGPAFRPGFIAGDNLYTSSFVALDVDTGKLKWYQQIVPGDEWELDQQVTPTVTDLEIAGETRRVAILPTTTGFLVLNDVRTGEFLMAHALSEEQLIHRGFEEDGTPIIDPEARITEPGGSVLNCPVRWVSFEPASYSPKTGLYYRPFGNECIKWTTYPTSDDWQPGQSINAGDIEFLRDRYDHYGGLMAINPVTGKEVWQFKHGYNWYGAGVVATAGNVVFGAFPDRIFRAFDAETGDIIWKQILPSAMVSGPMTYEVNGKQYIAVIDGNTDPRPHMSNVPPRVLGPAQVFVFALPEGRKSDERKAGWRSWFRR